jgi:FkbH-like protein
MKSVVRRFVGENRFDEALSLILQVRPDLSPDDLDYATRALTKIPTNIIDSRVPLRKRLAVLGGATTQYLVPLIRLFGLRRGINLDIYEGGFGLFENEIWSTSPELQAFAPDLIHFHLCNRNLSFPYFDPDPDGRLASEVGRFLRLYQSSVEKFSCPAIADNFAADLDHPYGSLDSILKGTRNSLIRATNEAIARALPSQVYIHDVNALSARHGGMRWFDWRLYNATKAAVSFESQPYYADSLAAAIAALFGKSKKCLIVDLDNTLWGGVIGDDGLDGIQLGAGQPDGEAFIAFQRYLKALKERGVVLAVASKNEMANALLPFREHASMVLKESDISCFAANWEPKDVSIRNIAKRLNVGLDSLVFFDDNPAERELVRSALPEVVVVDVPDEPSSFVHALDSARWFDALAVTEEDRERTGYFQSNAAREQLESEVSNYDEYLRRLSMTAVIEPVSDSNVTRITQLVNKTNQFNLTTRRMSEAEVRALGCDDRYYTASTRLSDRFGDNGLISVVIGHVDPQDSTLFHIDLWLMSCRVLKRGVELLDMEQLLEYCRSRGFKRIRGYYIPTPKNKLVEKHYELLGFTQLAESHHGTTWEYDIQTPLVHPHSIAVRRRPEP